jgi:hypothetical protein
MKWEQIKKIYRDEWVLVKIDDLDENLNVASGEVLAHSGDKEKIYKELLRIRPKEFSIEFTGDIPEDLAVVLCCPDAKI